MAGPDGPETSGGRSASPEDLGIQLTADESETLRARRGYVGVELSKGQTFDRRYEIGDALGAGGSGRVYRAQDRITGQAVALKLIRTDKLVSAEARERLIKEAVTARDVRHPNVVAVYDIGECEGQPYITMECLTGKSLRDWARERLRSDADVSFETAIDIVNGVLDGLEAAHALGVIHRDLKPENIFLAQLDGAASPKVKLLDFGIARAGGGRTESTSSPAGTPHYMAPEQITSPDWVRPSADFYSLSVVFYELLVGVLPQGYWQPPSQGRQDVPPGIDKLIEAGLSNRPRSRPQSAAEYRNALQAALASSPQHQPQRPAQTANPWTGGAKSPPQPQPAPRPTPPKPAIEGLAPGEPIPQIWGPRKDDPPKPSPPMSAAEMRGLAHQHFTGKGAKLDKGEARRLFGLAASAGDADAMCNFGWMLEKGEGGVVNEAQARAWYLKSAEAGQPQGMVNYAALVRIGVGGPRNEAEAIGWYRKAAQAGRADAVDLLAKLDAAKPKPQPTPPPAPPLDQRIASAPPKAEPPPADLAQQIARAEALAASARALADRKDPAWADACNEAHALFKQTVTRGHPAAKLAYGRFLNAGVGSHWPARPQLARQWFESAAKAGSREAAVELNNMPTPADPTEAALDAIRRALDSE